MNKLTAFSKYLALVFLCSCTKVITVNLNDVNPQIVIEGVITNYFGPYQVQITKTINFSQANSFPPVSGAVVKISDMTINYTDSLVETLPGIYTTQLLSSGVPGHSYRLNVLVNGQQYTANSTMPDPVPLDSLTFFSRNILGTENINAVANFQDPAGLANYYTFTEYVNGKQIDRSFNFDDRLSDGKYIRYQLFNDSSYIQKGDEVTVQMNCVDLNVWTYFNTLRQATGNDFSSVTPTNPVSNISNNALGYFSAQTTEIRKATLDK